MPFELKMANLATDGQLIQHARKIVYDILEQDPLLQNPTSSILKEQLSKLEFHRSNYTGIS